MRKVKKEVKEQEIVEDIICDCCGKSCKTDYGFEYMTMLAKWGFGSNKDMERWGAHICERCVDEKFSNINFTKENQIVIE